MLLVVVGGLDAAGPRIGGGTDDHALGADRPAGPLQRRQHGLTSRLGDAGLVGSPLDGDRADPARQSRVHQVEPGRSGRREPIRPRQEVRLVEHEPVIVGLGDLHRELFLDVEAQRGLDEVLGVADELVVQRCGPSGGASGGSARCAGRPGAVPGTPRATGPGRTPAIKPVAIATLDHQKTRVRSLLIAHPPRGQLAASVPRSCHGGSISRTRDRDLPRERPGHRSGPKSSPGQTTLNRRIRGAR